MKPPKEEIEAAAAQAWAVMEGTYSRGGMSLEDVGARRTQYFADIDAIVKKVEAMSDEEYEVYEHHQRQSLLMMQAAMRFKSSYKDEMASIKGDKLFEEIFPEAK